MQWWNKRSYGSPGNCIPNEGCCARGRVSAHRFARPWGSSESDSSSHGSHWVKKRGRRDGNPRDPLVRLWQSRHEPDGKRAWSLPLGKGARWRTDVSDTTSLRPRWRRCTMRAQHARSETQHFADTLTREHIQTHIHTFIHACMHTYGAFLIDVGTASHVSPSFSFVCRFNGYLWDLPRCSILFCDGLVRQLLFYFVWFSLGCVRVRRADCLCGSCSLPIFAALAFLTNRVIRGSFGGFLRAGPSSNVSAGIVASILQVGHTWSIWSGLQRVRVQASGYDGFCTRFPCEGKVTFAAQWWEVRIDIVEIPQRPSVRSRLLLTTSFDYWRSGPVYSRLQECESWRWRSKIGVVTWQRGWRSAMPNRSGIWVSTAPWSRLSMSPYRGFGKFCGGCSDYFTEARHGEYHRRLPKCQFLHLWIGLTSARCCAHSARIALPLSVVLLLACCFPSMSPPAPCRRTTSISYGWVRWESDEIALSYVRCGAQCPSKFQALIEALSSGVAECRVHSAKPPRWAPMIWLCSADAICGVNQGAWGGQFIFDFLRGALCAWVFSGGFRIGSGTAVTASAEQSRDHTVRDTTTLCQSSSNVSSLLDPAPTLHIRTKKIMRLTYLIVECLVQVPNVAKIPAGLAVHRMGSLLLKVVRLWWRPWSCHLRRQRNSQKSVFVPQVQFADKDAFDVHVVLHRHLLVFRMWRIIGSIPFHRFNRCTQYPTIGITFSLALLWLRSTGHTTRNACCLWLGNVRFDLQFLRKLIALSESWFFEGDNRSLYCGWCYDLWRPHWGLCQFVQRFCSTAVISTWWGKTLPMIITFHPPKGMEHRVSWRSQMMLDLVFLNGRPQQHHFEPHEDVHCMCWKHNSFRQRDRLGWLRGSGGIKIVTIQLQRPFLSFSSATVWRLPLPEGARWEITRLYLPALNMELKTEGPFKSERQRSRAVRLSRRCCHWPMWKYNDTGQCSRKCKDLCPYTGKSVHSWYLREAMGLRSSMKREFMVIMSFDCSALSVRQWIHAPTSVEIFPGPLPGFFGRYPGGGHWERRVWDRHHRFVTRATSTSSCYGPDDSPRHQCAMDHAMALRPFDPHPDRATGVWRLSAISCSPTWYNWTRESAQRCGVSFGFSGRSACRWRINKVCDDRPCHGSPPASDGYLPGDST